MSNFDFNPIGIIFNISRKVHRWGLAFSDGKPHNLNCYSGVEPEFNDLYKYFGRDSMIALRLLMPILTPDAIEAALGAVIERVNSTGALCHEETIGESLFQNI